MSEKIKTDDKSTKETNQQPANKKTKKKSKLKYILIIVLILAALAGYKIYQTDKEFKERMAEMQEQRQVMIDHWTEQGLSKEEIREKLMEQRPEGMENFQPSLYHSIMRGFRQVTGIRGPGGGPPGGIGGGMRPPQ